MYSTYSSEGTCTNTNSYLAPIFLWHNRHYLLQSWRFMVHSTTNDKCFRESLADQICWWALKISRLESCLSRKIAKHLGRWAAQQIAIYCCAVTIKKIGWLQVESNIYLPYKYDLLRSCQNVKTFWLPEKCWVAIALVNKSMCTIVQFS